MNARAILLVSLSVLVGFVLGRSVPNKDGDRSITTRSPSSPEVTEVSLNDPVGKALTELTGGKDLASFARLGSALAGLDSAQMAKLLDHVERNPLGLFDQRLGFLITRWVRLDPAAAAEWMKPRLHAAAQDGLPGLGFSSSNRGNLIVEWAKADPRAAVEYAKAHARTGLAAILLDEAIQKWPGKDPAERFAILQQFPAGKIRDKAVREHLWRWAEKKPLAAFAAAQGLGDEAERRQAQVYVMKQWVERDPASVFEQCRTLGISDPHLLSRTIGKGGEKDPRLAVEWLSSLSATQFARYAPVLVDGWAARDPAAALSWAMENGVALSQRYETNQRIEHDGLGRSTSSGYSGTSPMAKAFEAKPEETLAWIRSLPDQADRDRFLEMVVSSTKNPDQGITLMKELSQEAAERAAGSVGWRFQDNLEGGQAWAESLPAGRAKWNAWRGLGFADSEGSLEPPPPGPERDAYFSGRTLTWVGNDPISRLEMIAQVADPVLKRDLFDSAVEDTIRFKRGADWTEKSLEWLEKADFPGEWKQSWRAMAK